MDTRERTVRKREGQRRLSAQRARAGFLRGRVVAASILCFGLLWVVVFLQMATGNDPVLGAGPRAKATAARVTRPDRGRAQSEVEAQPEPEPEVEFEEPEIIEPEVVEPEIVEPEGEEFEEPEVVETPEAELEPLTTGQS